jgi:hypothetical protein
MGHHKRERSGPDRHIHRHPATGESPREPVSPIFAADLKGRHDSARGGVRCLDRWLPDEPAVVRPVEVLQIKAVGSHQPPRTIDNKLKWRRRD